MRWAGGGRPARRWTGRSPVSRLAQLGWAYLALGNLLLEMTDLPAAHAAYERALAAMRAARDRAGEGNVLVCAAQALRRAGRSAEMIDRYREAVEILTEVGDPVGLCMVEAALGRVKLREGDLTAAHTHGERALQLALHSHHPQGVRATLTLTGEIALAMGDLELAKERLTVSEAQARETHSTVALGSALTHLARVHAAMGERDLALAAGREACAIYDALNRSERDDIAAWLAELETAD